MCGIAGFVGAGDKAVLTSMTEALAHRGPDGEGYFTEEEKHLFLGHRRLAIVDVAGGEQPMWDGDGEICIVFNGEIYNHGEIRRELEVKGYCFRSDHSDTETLIYGYKEWGGDLPRRLNGMFAFAIYDRSRQQLFLARDRFGEKPLYYSDRPDLFAFASELTALTTHPALPRTADPAAVRKLFAYGYIPAPYAFWKGCRKLPAGHTLTYDLRSRRSAISTYSTFMLCPDRGLTEKHEPQLIEELRYLLRQAVQRRLLSDVPLGFFLSGGIDSSAVVAFAAQVLDPCHIKTFTIGFAEPSFDESAYARAVAQHLGTDHSEKILSIETAKDLIEETLSRLDEPLGDASILPTHLLSAFTRERVTVALSGDGGDELFAGYDPFDALKPASLYSKAVPAPLHAIFRKLAGLMPPSTSNMSFDFKIKRTLQGLSYPEAAWAPAWMAPLDKEEIADLVGEPVSLEELYGDAIDLWESGRDRGLTQAERLLEFFTRFYLPDDILAKVDRAAMMNSLESRAVFLDNDVADFCSRLPIQFKFRNGQRKYLLKKAVEGLLPDEIINRRKKGFGIPTTKWLRTIPPVLPVDAPLGADRHLALRWWKDHRAGRADHRLFLWTWLSAQSAGASPRLG
ncbi:asparagine synthase (glutamine-hydrolyzing) [Microvirga sp. BT689]|uniref:asparagine synthase (glutamine-hydrolyzing) n=1 Tax=Microvirga arvi TaxID=2778731 RepID=UPI00194E541C|nr:asparagine synthase (glutamine-hydrolyzing) [Microvirga arvi]MBM6583769.1 asparagine synthase (glutamine-hydrolyzing) [Microvirga arvi]